jgi:hypothetical protein
MHQRQDSHFYVARPAFSGPAAAGKSVIPAILGQAMMVENLRRTTRR